MDDPRQLEEYRVACWQFLDTKNGNSTTIADREDQAVRLVIGLLFEENRAEDAYLAVKFMVERLLCLEVSESSIAEILDCS